MIGHRYVKTHGRIMESQMGRFSAWLRGKRQIHGNMENMEPYRTPIALLPFFHESPKCPDFPRNHAESTHGKSFHESSMFSMNCVSGVEK